VRKNQQKVGSFSCIGWNIARYRRKGAWRGGSAGPKENRGKKPGPDVDFCRSFRIWAEVRACDWPGF